MDGFLKDSPHIIMGIALLWIHGRNLKDLGTPIITLPRSFKAMRGVWALLALCFGLAVFWFCFLPLTVGWALRIAILTGFPLLSAAHAGRLYENGVHNFGIKPVRWHDVEWFADQGPIIRLRLTRKGSFYGYFDLPVESEGQRQEILALLRKKAVAEKEEPEQKEETP